MKDEYDFIIELISEYRKEQLERLNEDVEVLSKNNIKNTDSYDYDPDHKWVYQHVDNGYINPETENKLDIWKHLKKK